MIGYVLKKKGKYLTTNAESFSIKQIPHIYPSKKQASYDVLSAYGEQIIEVEVTIKEIKVIK